MITASTVVGTVIAVERGETKGQYPKPTLTVVVQTAKNERGYQDVVAMETLQPEKFSGVEVGAMVCASFRAKSRGGENGRWWSTISLADLQVLVPAARTATRHEARDDYGPPPSDSQLPF